MTTTHHEVDASTTRLEALEADATTTRESFHAYRDGSNGVHSTSNSKMKLLKQNAEYAEARYERARRDANGIGGATK